MLDVRDGSTRVDADGDIDEDDRATDLVNDGIPSGPTALFTKAGPTIPVGPEQPVDVEFDNLTRRSYRKVSGKGSTATTTVADGG